MQILPATRYFELYSARELSQLLSNFPHITLQSKTDNNSAENVSMLLLAAALFMWAFFTLKKKT